MKIFVSHNRLIRAGAAAAMLLTLFAGALRSEDIPGLLRTLAAAVFAANAALFLSPLKNEDSICSLWFLSGALALDALACILCPDVGIMASAVCAASALIVLSYQSYRTINKYSRVRLLRTDDILIRSVREEARYNFLILLLLAFAAFLLADRYDGGMLILAMIIASGVTLLFLQYKRARTGRTCFISSAAESQICQMDTTETRPLPSSGSPELARMSDVYRRAVDYMETEKAYLNPDLTISLAARDLGVNRTYLSRIINTYSENNFSQFVGKYRIDYAAHMLEKDPSLKMMEVAMASGFRTVVSFNMVFKLNMKCTPSEYASRFTA